MKVICIKPIDKPDIGLEDAPRPSVGDIDEVTGTAYYASDAFYFLSRFNQRKYGYRADHFARLDSDIDETELIKERETVNA